MFFKHFKLIESSPQLNLVYSDLCRCRRRHRNWLLLLPPLAAVADGHCRRRRCQPLMPSPLPLPPPPAIVANRCRCYRCIRPVTLPPPAADNAGHCHCRRRLPSLLTTAAIASSRCRRRPPWSTRGPRHHHGLWRRLWRPRQPRTSLP